MGGFLLVVGAVLCLLMGMCTIEIMTGDNEEPALRDSKVRPTLNLKAIEPDITEAEKARTEDQKCRQDLQCWGDKHSRAVYVQCSDIVESYADYDHKWTDAWYESRFPKFVWGDKRLGKLKYYGDRIKFQNGFGGWQQMEYAVVYDPQIERCLGWYVRPKK